MEKGKGRRKVEVRSLNVVIRELLIENRSFYCNRKTEDGSQEKGKGKRRDRRQKSEDRRWQTADSRRQTTVSIQKTELF